jgi:5-methylcytosine-specific restriction enzyme A
MAKRPCMGRPGCPNLVVKGCCDQCDAKYSSRARAEAKRPSAAMRGYGRRWQKTSAGRLRQHPICVDPDGRHSSRLVAATETDHIEPHKGDMAKFWDPANWQSLCKSCHDSKTANEDGGFGRKPIVTNADVTKGGGGSNL